MRAEELRKMLAERVERLDLHCKAVPNANQPHSGYQQAAPIRPPDGEKKYIPGNRPDGIGEESVVRLEEKLDKHAAEDRQEFKDLLDEIDRIAAEQTMAIPCRKPVLSIVKGVSEYPIHKATGKRFSYFCRRLGMKPVQLLSPDGSPAIPGVYMADDYAYYDVVEAFNRLLDVLGVEK